MWRKRDVGGEETFVGASPTAIGRRTRTRLAVALNIRPGRFSLPPCENGGKLARLNVRRNNCIGRRANEERTKARQWLGGHVLSDLMKVLAGVSSTPLPRLLLLYLFGDKYLFSILPDQQRARSDFRLIFYMANYGRVGKCIMRKSKRYASHWGGGLSQSLHFVLPPPHRRPWWRKQIPPPLPHNQKGHAGGREKEGVGGGGVRGNKKGGG
jgi:hypothetical protein